MYNIYLQLSILLWDALSADWLAKAKVDFCKFLVFVCLVFSVLLSFFVFFFFVYIFFLYLRYMRITFSVLLFWPQAVFQFKNKQMNFILCVYYIERSLNLTKKKIGNNKIFVLVCVSTLAYMLYLYGIHKREGEKSF